MKWGVKSLEGAVSWVTSTAEIPISISHQQPVSTPKVWHLPHPLHPQQQGFGHSQVASFLPCVKDKDHWIESSFLLFASPVITLSHHVEGAWCLWALRWHTETWHHSREHRGVLTSGERRHHDVRKSRFFPSHYYVILTKETWSTLSVSPFLAHVFLKDTKPMSSPSPQAAPWGCPPLLLITFHADAAGPLLLLCMCDWSSVGWWWGTTRQEHATDTFGEVSSIEGFERHAKLQMEPDHPAFTKLVWKPWSNSQKTLLASYFL